MKGEHYWKTLLRAIPAGIAIGLGGCVLLGTMSINPELKWVGAILFSVGLFVVFTFGFDLYTGKVGYMFDGKEWTYAIDLLIMLVGNFIGALFVGLCIPMADQFVPGFIDARLDMLDDPLRLLLKGVICGILMFIAADVYKTKKSYLGAFVCVPTFILAGSEHRIAGMFYFCSAGVFSLDALIFILIVAAGNAIGGVLLPAFIRHMKEES